LVGYTESEVRVYFSKHIRALKAKLNIQDDDDDDVMNRLRESYNGYRFGLDTADGKVSEPIYNPFAINYVFNDLQLIDNWSLSGSASMLSDKLVAAGYQYDSLLSTTVDAMKRSYQPSDMSLTSLMYYGGYATIDSYDKQSKKVILKIPNASIQKYLAENYLASIFSKTGQSVLTR
jgi:Predicted AAA-ATPase